MKICLILLTKTGTLTRMGTFLSQEQTDKWLLSVNFPQMGQLFRFAALSP